MLDLQDRFTMSDVFEIRSCIKIGEITCGMIIWMLRRNILSETPDTWGWRCTYCDVWTDVSVQGTNTVVDAFDRRPSARTVQVEWGIGGLKNRFKSFISWCQSRRSLFAPMFEACCRLANFINRSRMDFSIMDVGHNELQEEVYGDLFAWQWG
jgi:hypothetical protein